ncbi:DUF1904 family protein [Brevibacillus fluminis]|uniref:DUF1904 family protein n=1 Tax=Brevibacillus fluminis TaxID=511487 RepID=UPI003F8BF44D
MPHLLVRGVSVEQMKQISAPLVEELAAICQCGTDNFTIDVLSTTAVFAGSVVESFPFIEVAWFERGLETRDRFAHALSRHVRGTGVAEIEVAFKTYREDSYYLNGERCFE